MYKIGRREHVNSDQVCYHSEHILVVEGNACEHPQPKKMLYHDSWIHVWGEEASENGWVRPMRPEKAIQNADILF